MALARLREAADEGAFDLALFEDKPDYRPGGSGPKRTALERLIAEGRVRLAKRRKRSAPRPVTAEGTVSDLVAEQRQ